MNKPIVAGVAVLAAVIAAAVLLKNDSPEPDPPPPATASTEQQPDNETAATVVQPPVTTAATSVPGQTDAHPVPSDPRLTALAVSPPNDLIEFVHGSDGQVIKEIDKDPASPGFNKPSREYMYSHGKVTGLTAYRYSVNQLETTRTAVSYKPDGSVDDLISQTTYSDQKQQR
ncbi:hypothetical protein [Steroidobacter sp.]|uniref:hypothetical protein n=1 Tax=Steroidobacter sp. TaxID=1978227 RepID=UPI001A4171D9|nr:hypothetical protein [Steroidobacter sp.]MBL8271744.1 hypothetical protein [Steroidobacter sp.]